MYHFIIKRIVRSVFDNLTAGDYEATLKQMAPTLEHVFPGDHALGGKRHTREAMRRWFQRLYCIFPNLQFEIKEILVKGYPWDTVAVVQWVDRATPVDGQPYVNEGVHVFRIRWGRGVGIYAYMDTQRIEEVCQRLVKLGIAEASAPPIID
ncbi:MAG: nuclear transport factor 2 family protein [Anaerolineae bacterium]